MPFMSLCFVHQEISSLVISPGGYRGGLKGGDWLKAPEKAKIYRPRVLVTVEVHAGEVGRAV